MTGVKITAQQLAPEMFPLHLQQFKQWTCWFLSEPNARGKRKKLAVKPSNQLRINPTTIEYTNPSNWADLETAVSCWRSNPHVILGVGFMFSGQDRVLLVDLDDSVKNGVVEPHIWDMVTLLDTYTELSQSGNGLHLMLTADWYSGHVQSRPFKLEVYGAPRWVAFTGRHLIGTPLAVEPRDIEMLLLEKRYFSKEKKQFEPTDYATQPQQQFSRKAEGDDAVLEWMFSWRNGAVLKAFYQGVVPSHLLKSDGTPDRSRADMSLLSSLLVACKGDKRQAERLYLRSALFDAARWNRKATSEGRTYGQLTLDNLQYQG
jgi:primase-polymerase (primpol)-like protein